MAFASDSTAAPARPLLPLPALDRRAIGRDGWARARELASRLGGEIRDHVAAGMRQAWAAARGLIQADQPAASRSVDQIGTSDVVPSYPDAIGAVPPLLPIPTPLPSLTAALSRRRAIFGAVAVAAVPAAALPAAAAELSLDADLLAIAPDWRASADRCDRARVALAEASARTPDVEPPEALFRRPSDSFDFAIVAIMHGPTGRQWYPASAVDRLAVCTLSNGRDEPIASQHARRAELRAAHAAWDAEVERVHAATGYTAADAEETAATEDQLELRRRILLMPAHTMAGVMFKARVVAWCFDSAAEVRREVAWNAERGSVAGEDMALSLAGDLAAMLERGVSPGLAL